MASDIIAHLFSKVKSFLHFFEKYCDFHQINKMADLFAPNM